jgi:hypothetical protein
VMTASADTIEVPKWKSCPCRLGYSDAAEPLTRRLEPFIPMVHGTLMLSKPREAYLDLGVATAGSRLQQ